MKLYYIIYCAAKMSKNSSTVVFHLSFSAILFLPFEYDNDDDMMGQAGSDLAQKQTFFFEKMRRNKLCPWWRVGSIELWTHTGRTTIYNCSRSHAVVGPCPPAKAHNSQRPWRHMEHTLVIFYLL
jgi:hypothetical protein